MTRPAITSTTATVAVIVLGDKSSTTTFEFATVVNDVELMALAGVVVATVVVLLPVVVAIVVVVMDVVVGPASPRNILPRVMLC